jgi:AcrR family transcriptional regulator
MERRRRASGDGNGMARRGRASGDGNGMARTGRESGDASAARSRAARARRSDGVQSHAAILEAAARLATVEGIEGLSIGRLADEVGMSKSGLFAHFGSKEELQLATIEAASDVFAARVTGPATDAPTAAERLHALVDGYLRYLEDDTFPGGCFFASVLAEVDMRPGAVRDRLVAFLGGWVGELEQAVRDAQAEGAVDAGEDPAQLVFEVGAALLYANTRYVVSRDHEPIERARRAIERRLSPR